MNGLFHRCLSCGVAFVSRLGLAALGNCDCGVAFVSRLGLAALGNCGCGVGLGGALLGLCALKEVQARLNRLVTLTESNSLGRDDLDKTALNKRLGSFEGKAEVLRLSFYGGNGVVLHNLCYKLKRVVYAALTLDLEQCRNLGEAGFTRHVLEVILGICVFARVKSEIEIEHLSLDVDTREMYSAALERLVLPARLCLDSVVGEQGVFDGVVPVGKGSLCLNKPRYVGTLVAYLNGRRRYGRSLGSRGGIRGLSFSRLALGLFTLKEAKARLNRLVTLAESNALGRDDLDKTALDKSLGGLVGQTEVLRLSFYSGNGVLLHNLCNELKRMIYSALALYLHK